MAGGIREQRRAFCRDTVQDWARSGLSKAAYAREHGLAAHQLCQWAARHPEWLDADEAVIGDTTHGALSSTPRFVTLAAASGCDQTSASASAIGIELASGHRLEVRPGFCSDTLQRVVAALSS